MYRFVWKKTCLLGTYETWTGEKGQLRNYQNISFLLIIFTCYNCTLWFKWAWFKYALFMSSWHNSSNLIEIMRYLKQCAFFRTVTNSPNFFSWVKPFMYLPQIQGVVRSGRSETKKVMCSVFENFNIFIWVAPTVQKICGSSASSRVVYYYFFQMCL